MLPIRIYISIIFNLFLYIPLLIGWLFNKREIGQKMIVYHRSVLIFRLINLNYVNTTNKL